MSKKQKIIFSIVFIICLFFQLLPVIRSGLKYDYGIGFWGSNGHDAIWHLSLINHISNPFKITLPIYSNALLNNYHPFFDILISYLSKITFINSSLWYFQIFPILSTIIFLVTSFKIGQKLSSNFFGGLLLMFLNSFANSFGWLVSLFRNHQISGESLFWSMQSPSNQLNPPYLLSLIFINILILLLLKNKTFKSFKNIFLIFLLLCLTPITKSYGGVVIYLIFIFYTLINFKKNKTPIKLLLISLPFSYFIFSIYNQISSSPSLFIFKPFWFVNSLIESPDRLYLPTLANMRYTLESANQIGPRLITLYIFLIGAFYLGNFSWRLLGLLSLKSFKNNLKLPLFFTILITALIPLFFIQKGTSWNTIQFLYYSLFISNIFLTIFLVNSTSKLVKYLVFPLIIFTTLVASYENFQRYLSNPAPADLPNQEIKALNFLKNQPKGIVLTYPYNKYLKNSLSTPIPLYAYETSAYVSAFSNQVSFLEDEMNLDITGFDWQSRRLLEEKFFTTNDKFFARGFLVNNKIDYIYLVNDQNFSIDTEILQIDNIFQNEQVKIYKVRR
jgi:hypothetical protein